MGGLAGIVHFEGDAPDAALVTRMAARLAHRGPDGEGSFAEGPIAVSHRRRQVAPTGSRQPVVADDVVLLLDGWIYDHEVVAAHAGSHDPAVPDTLALLEAWRRWGPGLVQHLDGDFAAAIWDRRAHTLHLVRDRMGVRPLYWIRRGPRVAFASELPALLEVPWIDRRLAREHLAEYLSFRVVHAPRTLVRDVQQVEAAHWVHLSATTTTRRGYWRPAYALPGAQAPRESDVVAELEEAVRRAVRRRLADGARSGLYLSGGLGSTAIAAAARALHRDLPSFTLAFADGASSERPIAGRVAGLLGLDHHEVVVGSSGLAEVFDDGVRALGHPVGNAAVFLQLRLAQAAREHVRVVLSGDGGEELFGGRMLAGLPRHLALARAFQRLPGSVRRGVGTAIRRHDVAVDDPTQFGLARGLGGSKLFDSEDRAALLRDPTLVRRGVRREVLAPFYADLHTDPINAVLNAYLRSWLAEESLVRADRTAAAAGIDVRFPLLDQEVIALASALPGSFKLRRRMGSIHSRWLLSSLLTGVLPPPLVNRPKRGMPTPMGPWLAEQGRLFLDARVRSLREDRAALLRREAIDDLVATVGRDPRAGVKLWSLFVLDGWLAAYGIS